MAVNIDAMTSFDTLVECCSPLLAGPLSQEEAEQLATALKVLADPARLRLISQLAGRPAGEACVCELTAPLGLTQPTVSHHLKVLHEAGLVDRERRGSWVYYRLLSDRFDALYRLLSQQPRTSAAPVA
jgi:ArsR family transcriptional regulator